MNDLTSIQEAGCNPSSRPKLHSPSTQQRNFQEFWGNISQQPIIADRNLTPSDSHFNVPRGPLKSDIHDAGPSVSLRLHVWSPTTADIINRPCRRFQIGKCDKGSQCTFAHVSDPNFRRRPCQHFAQGRCKHGGKCTFSHDLNAGANKPEGTTTSRADSSSAPLSTTEARFRQWRYGIPLETARARRLGPKLATFYQTALDLIVGEPGIVQQIITLLSSEGGMIRVGELLEQPFEDMGEAQLASTINTQLLPFFQTITHENVTSSAILESKMKTMHNFVFGFGGMRAVRVFQAVARHLTTCGVATLKDHRPDEHLLTSFEASLATLALVMQVNTVAQAHDALVPIVEQISALLEDEDLFSDAAKFALRRTKGHLHDIELRLGIGKALPSIGGNAPARFSKPIFLLAKELPGELSENGPRHDNDKVDIRNVSILPTREEIQSSRTEYLPTADPVEWHLGGLEGLLDRNFRLLREDTIGQLRDAAKFELESLTTNSSQNDRPTRDASRARTFVYRNVHVVDILFHQHAGLEFLFAFDQPKHLRAMSVADRREWWAGSKRMGADALLCMLGDAGDAWFFSVAPELRPLKTPSDDSDDSRAKLTNEFNLHTKKERAYVLARPVKQENIQLLVEQVVALSNTTRRSLVEFPGVLLPAFMPTLQAMQEMSETMKVPFADILAPVSTRDNPGRQFDLSPPAYATRPGFRFDLSALTNDKVPVRLDPSGNRQETVEALEKHTSLDSGQAEALVSSLSRRLALIQGPPGTGKSYTGLQIIRALIANAHPARLGPIVCVTYTNHALDQALERLIDTHVGQIVRLGGGSKSPKVADINLRVVAQNVQLTKTEKSDRWKHSATAKIEGTELQQILARLHNMSSQDSIEQHLKSQHEHFHRQIFGGLSPDGWETVNRRPKSILTNWLKGGRTGLRGFRPLGLLQTLDAHQVAKEERQMLYQSWIDEIQECELGKFAVVLRSYELAKRELDAIRTETDLRILRQANVIGITTSGLARNLNLLRRVNAKVLMCEEAGEVLEAHLLTAFLPSLEHAILIGDHLQLRPQVQNYELSSESGRGGEYSLDISLFERLVVPNNMLPRTVPYCALAVQRRMHPSISQLVRRTLYPSLQDAPSVDDHPQVSGMRHRLFWMHHAIPENEDAHAQSTSHVNDFECNMAAALVSHLIKQGIYTSDDIAIITPYLGQLRNIRRKLTGTFEVLLNDRDEEELAQEDQEARQNETSRTTRGNGISRGTLLQAVRIATVDNFQGEEAKVVVVSLVRSNKDNKPGFLRTSNRINVLLSRAKHGMYVLGNAQTMQRVPMWCQVFQIFQNDGLAGDALELCCPRHPDTSMMVKQADDFLRVSPEAGCDRLCDQRLPCGHACSAKCHSEMLHKAVYCTESCTRPKAGCLHSCNLHCGQPCEKQCQEIVGNIRITPPACDHVSTALPCYQVQNPSKIRCSVPVQRRAPHCGHETILSCHVDVGGADFQCNAKCGRMLACGHACLRRCYQCMTTQDGRVLFNHRSCTATCDRNFTTCSHRCRKACHGEEPCPLCEESCEVRCTHSKCDKKCSEPCVPCAEAICSSHCTTHKAACTLPCAAPCNWLPCSGRCSLLLSCGCRCPSVCGEICPDANFCQNCASDDVKEQQADVVMMSTYKDIDLDEDPCVFPDCGHVFTLSSMDGVMDMAKHYEVDRAGALISIKKQSEPFSSDELKQCPSCRGSLRSLARYGRITRRAVLDESTKKFTVWSNRLLQDLAARLATLQEHLDQSLKHHKQFTQDVQIVGEVEEQVKVIVSLRTSQRYRVILRLHREIQRALEKLHADEQPFQRVRDLVEAARRTSGRFDGDGDFVIDSSEIQLSGQLQATGLLIRCEMIMLLDIISIFENTPTGKHRFQLVLDFAANRDICERLINDATRTMNVRQRAEGHILWAKLAAMERGALIKSGDSSEMTMGKLEELQQKSSWYLAQAVVICAQLSTQTDEFEDEIEDVRRMIREGVSTSEMQMVFNAMAREFQGTGHWYRCVNGHPFTVGECGMPMQSARCPACGEGIGGRNHRSQEGVSSARDIEERFGSLHLGQR